MLGKILLVSHVSFRDARCLFCHSKSSQTVLHPAVEACPYKVPVQRIWPAFLPLGEAKGDWEIIALISAKVGTPLVYQHSQDIFKDIAATLTPFSGMTYEKISDQGMVLKA